MGLVALGVLFAAAQGISPQAKVRGELFDLGEAVEYLDLFLQDKMALGVRHHEPLMRRHTAFLVMNNRAKTLGIVLPSRDETAVVKGRKFEVEQLLEGKYAADLVAFSLGAEAMQIEVMTTRLSMSSQHHRARPEDVDWLASRAGLVCGWMPSLRMAAPSPPSVAGAKKGPQGTIGDGVIAEFVRFAFEVELAARNDLGATTIPYANDLSTPPVKKSVAPPTIKQRS